MATITIPTQSKTSSAQAFLHSLSVLLHAGRMYGAGHRRTKAQMETTWRDLCAAVAQCGDEGLILGISEPLLLVGGTPARHNPRLDSMIRMLSRGRVSSLRFAPRVTFEDFQRFVAAFSGAEKNEVLAEHLRAHLAEDSTVSINSVRYVPEDSARETANISNNLTAALMAGTLGADPQNLQAWLDDPGKLLQLLLASEGTRGDAAARGGTGAAGAGLTVALAGTPAGTGSGAGTGTGAAGGRGSGEAAPGTITIREEDLEAILRVLATIAQAIPPGAAPAAASEVKEQMGSLTESASAALRDALQRLQSAAHTPETDGHTLVRVAEQLAIRLALQRYEQGKTPINIVQAMLNRMGREIKRLRELLYAEASEHFTEAENLEYQEDDLTHQFWMALPEASMLSVLRSAQVWCVPARNVREVLERLAERSSTEPSEILENLAGCLKSRDVEVQHRTAAKLIELADWYVRPETGLARPFTSLFSEVILQNPDQRYELGAVLARFFEMAFQARAYPVLSELLAGLHRLAEEQAWVMESLWPRLGVDEYLSELIEEALRAPEVPAEIVQVLREAPQWTARRLADRLLSCTRRRERDRVVALVQEMGAEGVQHLTALLREGTPEQAAAAIGLLVGLEPATVESSLLERIVHWDLPQQDALVRQLAASAVPERGHMLCALLPRLHPLVRPLAIEEIAMSRDPRCAPLLVGVAGGHHADWATPFLRVKAIEALAYLGCKQAAPVLFTLVEERRLLGYVHHEELRLAAAQALLQLDPGWTKSALSASGLGAEEMKLSLAKPGSAPVGVRKRSYERVRLPRPMAVRLVLPEGEQRVEVRDLSLGGGPCPVEEPLADSAEGTVELRVGLRTIRPKVLLRARRSGPMAFQIVEMNLDERAQLRKMLTEARAS